jgi:hypothetical protein
MRPPSHEVTELMAINSFISLRVGRSEAARILKADHGTFINSNSKKKYGVFTRYAWVMS